MAKGIGLIGNFRGKVGNMVGYNLKDSNNKQTQGVRVYQPIVKNPKSYAQAEQRAKLAPINATYRALKMVIDRGQETKAYGNKSRLAWLSEAMKAFNGGWFEKGQVITLPAIVPLTDGQLSLPVAENLLKQHISLPCATLNGEEKTVGDVSKKLLATYPQFKDGDQITFVEVYGGDNGLTPNVGSFLIDSSSTDAIPAGITILEESIAITPIGANTAAAGSIILSRDGNGGSHLRSKASLVRLKGYENVKPIDLNKEAAIKSYMSGGSNTDWAEEALQG